jgi:hypothetical protein
VLFSSQRAFIVGIQGEKKACLSADRLQKYYINFGSQVKNLLFSKKLLINSFRLFWLMPIPTFSGWSIYCGRYPMSRVF